MKEVRKTIQVNEAVHNEFIDRKEALGMNSSDCLQELLKEDMKKTIIIEKGMTFRNCEKMVKRCE